MSGVHPEESGESEKLHHAGNEDLETIISIYAVESGRTPLDESLVTELSGASAASGSFGAWRTRLALALPVIGVAVQILRTSRQIDISTIVIAALTAALVPILWLVGYLLAGAMISGIAGKGWTFEFADVNSSKQIQIAAILLLAAGIWVQGQNTRNRTVATIARCVQDGNVTPAVTGVSTASGLIRWCASEYESATDQEFVDP